MISEELKQEACGKLNCDLENLDAIDWSEYFSNTNGPHRGLISGQAFTSFEVHGFRRKGEQEGIKHCDGVWKEWNGDFEEPWDKPKANHTFSMK